MQLFLLQEPASGSGSVGTVGRVVHSLDMIGIVSAEINLKSRGFYGAHCLECRPMLSTHAKGLLITACGVLVISPDGLLTRLITTDHWTMIFWRALLLSFSMWLLVNLVYPNRAWQQYRSLKGPGMLMAICYSLGTISFIYAITHTSVANTLIILSTTPLFAAILGRIFMQEKIELRTLVAIAMVTLGLVVIASGSDDRGSLEGDLVAVLGSFFLACGFSFVRRYPRISSFSAISCSGLLTALMMLPFAAPLSVSQADMGYLLIMGLYMLPIGTALMFIGPRYITAAEVGLLLLLESILGPLWVWLALGEEPGPHSLVGGAIVISTLAVNTIWGLARPVVKTV